MLTDLAGNSMSLPDVAAVFYSLMLSINIDAFSEPIPTYHQGVDALHGPPHEESIEMDADSAVPSWFVRSGGNPGKDNDDSSDCMGCDSSDSGSD